MTEKCPCDCKSLPEFTLEDARKVILYVGEDLPVLTVYTPGISAKDVEERPEEANKAWETALGEMLVEGMNEEREHCDVTHGDAVLTAKIALAHLKEDPDYYAKLKKAGL